VHHSHKLFWNVHVKFDIKYAVCGMVAGNTCQLCVLLFSWVFKMCYAVQKYTNRRL